MMSRSPYKLKYEIETKLFNGIVIPTAESQGFDMSDQHKIVKMMEALAKKYHSMSKDERKFIISKAEMNIKEKLELLNQ